MTEFRVAIISITGQYFTTRAKYRHNYTNSGNDIRFPPGIKSPPL